MDKATHNTPASSEDQSTSLAGRLLKLLAYPVATIAGLWSANVSVHNSSYNTAKALGVFDDILETKTPQSKADVQDALNDKINTEEFTRRWMGSKTAYQQAADARLEKLGLDSFSKKWNYMAKSGKHGAIRSGLAGFGVTIGAMFAASNSKTISHTISQQSSADEQSR